MCLNENSSQVLKLKCDNPQERLFVAFQQFSNDIDKLCNSSSNQTSRCFGYQTKKLADECNGKQECQVTVERPVFKFGFAGSTCNFQADLVTVGYDCIPGRSLTIFNWSERLKLKCFLSCVWGSVYPKIWCVFAGACSVSSTWLCSFASLSQLLQFKFVLSIDLEHWQDSHAAAGNIFNWSGVGKFEQTDCQAHWYTSNKQSWASLWQQALWGYL